jgi:hypothetical protein
MPRGPAGRRERVCLAGGGLARLCAAARLGRDGARQCVRLSQQQARRIGRRGGRTRCVGLAGRAVLGARGCRREARGIVVRRGCGLRRRGLVRLGREPPVRLHRPALLTAGVILAFPAPGIGLAGWPGLGPGLAAGLALGLTAGAHHAVGRVALGRRLGARRHGG